MIGEPVSHCGCVLPLGWWGSDGWHWRKSDAEMLYARERRRFWAERANRGTPAYVIQQEWDAWVKGETEAGRMVNGLHEVWRSSLGLPFAMERCAPYMSVWRDGRDTRTKETSRQRKDLFGD